MHGLIEGSRSPRVNDRESVAGARGLSESSSPQGAYEGLTRGDEQILAPLHLHYARLAERPYQLDTYGESPDCACATKETGESEEIGIRDAGRVLGILACTFTALTGGLPIKWVLQLLEVIQ